MATTLAMMEEYAQPVQNSDSYYSQPPVTTYSDYQVPPQMQVIQEASQPHLIQQAYAVEAEPQLTYGTAPQAMHSLGPIEVSGGISQLAYSQEPQITSARGPQVTYAEPTAYPARQVIQSNSYAPPLIQQAAPVTYAEPQIASARGPRIIQETPMTSTRPITYTEPVTYSAPQVIQTPSYTPPVIQQAAPGIYASEQMYSARGPRVAYSQASLSYGEPVAFSAPQVYQTPSYTPPPVQQVFQTPSYTPPPVFQQASPPVFQQAPRITYAAPQMNVAPQFFQQPSYTPPVIQPAPVEYAQQFEVTQPGLVETMAAPMSVAPPIMQQIPSYVPPVTQQAAPMSVAPMFQGFKAPQAIQLAPQSYGFSMSVAPPMSFASASQPYGMPQSQAVSVPQPFAPMSSGPLASHAAPMQYF